MKIKFTKEFVIPICNKYKSCNNICILKRNNICSLKAKFNDEIETDNETIKNLYLEYRLMGE